MAERASSQGSTASAPGSGAALGSAAQAGAALPGVRADPFLDELVQYLKGDTKQSHFLKAWADKSASKVDLCALRHWDSALDARVMRQLLKSGELAERFPLKPSEANKQGRQLFSLVQRNREERRDFGVDSLRIGFPLVRCVDAAGRALLAPLVLWKVKLEVVKGKYVLSREWEDPVELNDPFCQFMSAEREVELKGKQYERKTSINDCDVEQLVRRVLPALSAEEVRDGLRAALEKGLELVPPASEPPKRARKKSGGGGAPAADSEGVVWGAVLALFKTGNSTILRDLEGYRRRGATELSTEPILRAGDLHHSGLALDPSQFEAVRQLAHSKNLVINGPPGTGKSQTLTALLSCAGANGLRTLVVCEKKTPLEILQRKLGELRWQHFSGDKFSALITNVQEREEVVARALRNRADVESLSQEACQAEERTILQDVRRLEREIAQEENKFVQHKKINSQVVSFNLTVQDAIAFVIKAKLRGNKELPLPAELDLSTRIFAEDHLMRLNRCEENLPKETVEAFKSVQMGRLGRYFSPDSLVNAAAELQGQLETLLGEREAVISAAKEALVAQLEQEVDAWNNHYEELCAIKVNLADVPKSEIQSYDSPTWLDAIVSLLHASKSKLRYFRSALQNIERGIRSAHGDALTMPTNFTLSNIERVVKWCAATREVRASNPLALVRKETLAETWAKRRSQVPAADMARFRAKNEAILAALRDSPFATPRMLARFKSVLEEKGDRGDCLHLLKHELLPFDRDSLSTWRQASESVNCLLEFGLLQDQQFFLDLIQRCRAESTAWGARIKLCILERELEGKCKGLITSDFVLDKLSDSLAQIQQKVQMLFSLKAARRMHAAVEAYERDSRLKFEQFYNRDGKNIRANSLREIVKNLDLFTACFPVIFCTPEAASALFKGRSRYFDLVVVDEASQSLTHDAYAALLKGRKVVIAGDNKQMPPTTLFNASGANIFDSLDEDLLEVDETFSDDAGADTAAALASGGKSLMSASRNSRNAANAESLLDYATDHSFSFQSVDLGFHYRSSKPDLMRFHCAAVYPKLALCPERSGPRAGAPAREPAIELVQVPGVYRDQGNREEATAIVELLQRLVRSPLLAASAASAPASVAVATFNEVQKKQILKAIKACPDQILMQRLRELQSRQLFFVKNLEHLQGDEVDVLVIGTTFGPNANGVFERRFGRITFQGIGYRYLNVLFSRAKRKVFVVTSIPEHEFRAPERVLDEVGTLSGTSMLFGYLSYAKAVSSSDSQAITSVLREYAVEGSADFSAIAGNASLENVIYESLTRRADADQIVRETSPHSLLRGILVKLNNSRSLVIECGTYDSYRQSIHRKAVLAKFGYEYYQIWPANWLDNPRTEYDKLRRTINEVRRKNRAAPPEDPLPAAAPAPPAAPPQRLQALADEDDQDNMDVDEEEETKLAHGARAGSGAPSPRLVSAEEPVLADKSMLGTPYLVKYGARKKFIVFRPESIARGSPDILVGHLGQKKIKVAASRLLPLRAGFPREAFLNELEFSMAEHHLAASPSPAPPTVPARKRKPAAQQPRRGSTKRVRKPPKTKAACSSEEESEWQSGSDDDNDEDFV